jgi:hypothetical protein
MPMPLPEFPLSLLFTLCSSTPHERLAAAILSPPLCGERRGACHAGRTEPGAIAVNFRDFVNFREGTAAVPAGRPFASRHSPAGAPLGLLAILNFLNFLNIVNLRERQGASEWHV